MALRILPRYMAEVGSVDNDVKNGCNNEVESAESSAEANNSTSASHVASSSSTSDDIVGKKRKPAKSRAAPAKRGKKASDVDEIEVFTKYLEESEKRDREFLLKLTEMEERQHDRNVKIIAEIAKMLKN